MGIKDWLNKYRINIEMVVSMDKINFVDRYNNLPRGSRQRFDTFASYSLKMNEIWGVSIECIETMMEDLMVLLEKEVQLQFCFAEQRLLRYL
jgi:hypothetical protein